MGLHFLPNGKRHKKSETAIPHGRYGREERLPKVSREAEWANERATFGKEVSVDGVAFEDVSHIVAEGALKARRM